MAKIAAICISDVRGIQKHEIPEAFLKRTGASREMPMPAIGTDR